MNYLTYDPYREFSGIFGSGTTPARSDGLLHVEIPKREEAKPRQIRISDDGAKEGRGKDKPIDVQTRA